MGVIYIEGLEQLQKKLKKNANMDDVKKVVKHNGLLLQKKIQRNADFKKGYQTGTTKRSVGLKFKDGGLSAESGAATEYAEYLEFGTRFMQAQPFIKPSLEEQSKEFESDLKKLVK